MRSHAVWRGSEETTFTTVPGAGTAQPSGQSMPGPHILLGVGLRWKRRDWLEKLVVWPVPRIWEQDRQGLGDRGPTGAWIPEF